MRISSLPLCRQLNYSGSVFGRLAFLTVAVCLSLGSAMSSEGCAAEPRSASGGKVPAIRCTKPFGCELSAVITGLERPLHLATTGDGSKLLYITEQGGTVRVAGMNGELDPTPLLNISNLVSGGSEQGLLSIAFVPPFKSSSTMLVNYTDRRGDTIVARYKLAGPHGPIQGGPETLLKIEQPYSNHNGGLLLFGPDGMLYIGMGDGGSANDPHGNGQKLDTLLGKMLRMQVAPDGRLIPAPGNPFEAAANVNGKPVKTEIWAYGLRNPWRYSFDRETRRLFVADVGQNAIEEVDIVERGANMGWNRFEGSRCMAPPCPPSPEMVRPIAEYGRSEGQSITGGFVYRGTKVPQLKGKYVFGDFGSGKVWALTESAESGWKRELLVENAGNVSSFGEDDDGELYLIDYRGTVYRFDPQR